MPGHHSIAYGSSLNDNPQGWPSCRACVHTLREGDVSNAAGGLQCFFPVWGVPRPGWREGLSRQKRGENGQRYFDSNCSWRSRGDRVRNSTVQDEEESSTLNLVVLCFPCWCQASNLLITCLAQSNA